MKQKLGQLEQVDDDLFKDQRGRYILVDYKTGKAYIVDDKTSNWLGIFSSRGIIAAMIAVFVGSYISWVWGIVGAVVCYVVMENSVVRFMAVLPTESRVLLYLM